jgi:uncharacterized membrane protein SpoIIM required for sporulation
MSAWQLVDQTLRTALLITVVGLIVAGTLEAMFTVAEAAERDEIDD